MSILVSRLRVIAVPVVLGLGLVATVASGGLAKSQEPAVCGINATSGGGMIALQAVFTSDADVTASYQFKVVSSGPGGNTTVSQGGQFAAVANQTKTVGQMSINDGSTYDVDFKVTVDGAEMDCSQTIPSRT
jgi:hypothetical protein